MGSIMWQYINEEADVANKIYESKNLYKIAEILKCYESIYFVAHGSSYNACKTVEDFYARKTKTRTYCYKPHEFRCDCHSLLLEDRKNTIIVGISQTGTSRGVLEALLHAKQFGFNTLALTAQADSPIVEESDYWADICCGREDSNAKTKGYTCTLVTLLLLAIHTGYCKNTIQRDEYHLLMAEVHDQIGSLSKTVTECHTWCENRNYGKTMEKLFIIGYGMNYGSALEMGLKVLETTCIPTVLEDVDEFSHGTHRAVDSSSHMIILCTDRDGQQAAEKSFEFFRKICKSCVLLNATGEKKEFDDCINLSYAKEIESILTMTTAIQVLSVFIPENQCEDPNRNANDEYTAVLQTRV